MNNNMNNKINYEPYQPDEMTERVLSDTYFYITKRLTAIQAMKLIGILLNDMRKMEEAREKEIEVSNIPY